MSILPTLFNLILDQASVNGDAPALVSTMNHFTTYRQLVSHLRAVCLQLIQLGINRGDRIAVALPNGPEMATTYLAVSAVCTCAPLNPAYSAGEFEYYLNDLRVKALILPAGDSTPARYAAAQLRIPILEIQPNPVQPGVFTLTSNFVEDSSAIHLEFSSHNDVALILHTSGTTSRPKIVPLTQRNITYSIHNIARTYHLGPTDRVLNMMPLFHIHGIMAALSATLATGGSIICAPGLRQDQVLDWMVDLKPTWYTAVPALQQVILEQSLLKPEITALIKLRFIRSSSSAMPPVVAEGLEKAFGAPVLEAYGMTEAAHQIASNPMPPRTHKFGSVGMPTGTTSVCILDESGKMLPENTLGEIAIFGENVISGYENNPEANCSSFVDGWLRTGDCGILDAEGYLFIQGRLKELINRGGEKISPYQVEEVLLRHPAVKQAAVFGIPHPMLGEEVAAAVVLYPYLGISMQELRRFAASHLADFKVPRQIVFLNEIPKNSIGKIQRIGMADRLKTELEALKTREAGGEYAPLTPVEVSIQSIWQQVLGKQQVGVQDDFLVLGGESLQAARILMDINEKFGTDLIISDIFDSPTIAMMARVVQTKLNTGV